MQVGYVGLLKAISNFDPAAGASLATYAKPCITGELKRHFRDKRWHVHVKHSVQELVLQVREATGQLAQELGRTPADSDLARHLGVSGDDLRQARRAEMAFQPFSLDAPLGGQPGMSTLAEHAPVAVHRTTRHRTEVAMFVAAGFALAGLLAIRVLPPAGRRRCARRGLQATHQIHGMPKQVSPRPR
jgi:DNA-directed RNA polymerase specialized sigma subunit